MGASLSEPRPRSPVPRMGWRARERWYRAKEEAAERAAQLLLEEKRRQILLPYLYASLGGDAQATSPIVLKGGAAFILFMSREIAFYGEALPPSVRRFADTVDLDFACREPARVLMPRVAGALPWLAEYSQDLWRHFDTSCGSWQLRRDGYCGEAYFDSKRFPLGVSQATDLPIKCSFHGGLQERCTGAAFQLVRIGAALWQRRTCRSTIAAFVDISLGGTTVHSTICVMGIRVETPRSMLKALRRMISVGASLSRPPAHSLEARAPLASCASEYRKLRLEKPLNCSLAAPRKGQADSTEMDIHLGWPHAGTTPSKSDAWSVSSS